MTFLWLRKCLQGGQDQEDCEVDLDDDGQVVQGKGIGKVGDDDQDGGWEEGGEHVAHQWARKLKNHQEPGMVLMGMYSVDCFTVSP